MHKQDLSYHISWNTISRESCSDEDGGPENRQALHIKLSYQRYESQSLLEESASDELAPIFG